MEKEGRIVFMQMKAPDMNQNMSVFVVLFGSQRFIYFFCARLTYGDCMLCFWG